MLKKSAYRILKFVLHLALFSFLILLLVGCQTKEATAAKIKSVSVEDASFLKDSKGVPVAVKLVSNVVLQGEEGNNIDYSCKLMYSDELVGNGIDLKAKIEKGEMTKEVTLLAPVQRKLVISSWKMCCDLKAEKDFNSISQTTVCSS